MTTDGNTYRRIKELERDAEKLGLQVTLSNYSGSLYLTLTPDGDNLPCYSRTADIAVGSAEYLLGVLHGWEKAITYLKIMGIADEKRIDKGESNFRQKRLIDALRGKVAANSDK